MTLVIDFCCGALGFLNVFFLNFETVLKMWRKRRSFLIFNNERYVWWEVTSMGWNDEHHLVGCMV